MLQTSGLTSGNPPAMYERVDEMKQIEKWLKQADMPESRLGLLACANPRAVERIRQGTARVETLRLVLAYIRQHMRSIHGG